MTRTTGAHSADGTFPAFTVATRVVTGVGCLQLLDREMTALDAARFAVVADRGVVEAGVLDTVLAHVDRSRVAAIVPVDPDPDVAAAERAAQAAIDAGCDGVVAVGGGSGQGAAKAVAIRLTNPGPVDRYAGVDRVPMPPAPTIAVPTTAGSGGEVSRVLVLHEPGRREEMVVRGVGYEPRVALLDATVLRSLPYNPLLFAALDALTHGIESQWARRGSSFVAHLGLGAARTVIDVLPTVLAGVASGANAEGGTDTELQLLLEAACAANMACGNSGLALVHALSTAPSVHLAHGLQNGVLLPHVARFNSEVSAPVVRRVVAELDGLYDRIAFQPRFPTGSVGDAEVTAMIEASTGHPFRENNLRRSTDDELRELLLDAVAAP